MPRDAGQLGAGGLSTPDRPVVPNEIRLAWRDKKHLFSVVVTPALSVCGASIAEICLRIFNSVRILF
jgi:hypothetical protein